MSDTNPDRAIRLYFGRDIDDRPSKSEVAEFITDEMQLTQGPDDDPKWSEGIGELLDLGMDAYADRLDAINPGDRKRIEELESKVNDYRAEVKKLRAELNKDREAAGHLDAATRVHRIEASILEVLCQAEAAGRHTGPRGMNYVELYDVARATGYNFKTVLQYARTLSKSEFGEHVQLSRYEEEAKATSRDAFAQYCEATGVDPDRIRRQTEDL